MYNLFRDSSDKLIAMISGFQRTAFLASGLIPALLALAADAGAGRPGYVADASRVGGGVVLVDPLASEAVLTGRAERDNWGVPTMFGRKGSATVAQ